MLPIVLLSAHSSGPRPCIAYIFMDLDDYLLRYEGHALFLSVNHNHFGMNLELNFLCFFFFWCCQTFSFALSILLIFVKKELIYNNVNMWMIFFVL